MAVTIEQFKQAFSAGVADNELKRKDEQVAAALKSLKKTVDSLEQSGADRNGKNALVEVVRRYDRAKKRNASDREIAAELESIHRTVMALIAELDRALGSATDPAAPPDAGPSQSDPASGPSPDGSVANSTEDEVPDQRKDFRAARQRWVKVRDKAVENLEVVKAAICTSYMDDPEQLPIVLKRLKDLDEIMDNVSDDLRDVLDAYVGTRLDQHQRLEELATEARELLSSFLGYVRGSKLLAAIDQKEFANVTVKAPMESALKNLAATIA